ncbi:MAG: DUF2256 domain-containing protein [Gammaproteobacteria bacterium]|nr:DUF2256 domain-containing protein [Gammaproteobacteria bacterium]
MAYAKTNLPEKICQHCLRPFSWRKKWWRCWDEVKYCSERCKRQARSARDRPQQNLCASASAEDEF